MAARKAFTMVELMVVIIIAGILATVAVPLMRGKVEQAKWSEAAAAAGAIRSANRTYFSEHASGITGALTATKAALLGFETDDLTGSYFIVTNYSIGTVSSVGFADITVTSTNLPGYTGTLTSNGWTVTKD